MGVYYIANDIKWLLGEKKKNNIYLDLVLWIPRQLLRMCQEITDLSSFRYA